MSFDEKVNDSMTLNNIELLLGRVAAALESLVDQRRPRPPAPRVPNFTTEEREQNELMLGSPGSEQTAYEQSPLQQYYMNESMKGYRGMGGLAGE